MIALALIFLVIYIGLIGWLAHSLFFHDSSAQESNLLEPIMLRFLSGFGSVSVILLVAALTGFFFKTVILSSGVGLMLLFISRKGLRRSLKTVMFLYYIIFCLLLGCLSFAIAKLTPPYEAVIYGSDASSYVASAFQMVNSGSLSYVDPLVLEMKPEERELFYSQAERTYGRFPGGVLIVRPDLGIVHFGFLPLFPAWLGLGIFALGSESFLYMLSFFTAMGVLVLFMLGRKVSSLLVGLSLPFILFFFYPEFYFSRMPWSEAFAQTLFCAGLYVFLADASPRTQRLSAILWGCLFLCRIDLAFFLIASVVLIFCVHPRYSSQWKHWRTFLIGLTIFELCTFYWQLRTGAHLWVPALSEQKVSQIAWLPIVSRLHAFMIMRPIWGPVLFVGISLILIVLIHFWLGQKSDRQARLLKRIGPVFALTLTALVIGKFFRWDKFIAHVKWILVYIPTYHIVALVAGFLIFLYVKARQEKSGTSRILLLLFIPPALLYLIFPLIKLEQPLYVRRFIPEVFPLFFLISLTGWDAILKKWHPRSLVPRLLLLLFVFSLTASFFQASAYLRQEPIFSNVISQVRKIAARFPDDALIITPAADAVIQMGLPLKYGMNQETISMPQEEKNHLVEDFLKRQLALQRPIFFLSLGNIASPTKFQNSFLLKPEFEERVSFKIVAPVEVDQFPDRTAPMQLVYHAHRLVLMPWRDQIDYDDREVTFVNFHVVENGFRWSKAHSEVRNFIHDTQGKEIRLIFATNPLSEGLDVSGLQIFLNGNIPTRFIKRESSSFHFQVEQTGVSRIESVTIETKTFVPRQLGINNDPRSLGIPFVKISFQHD